MAHPFQAFPSFAEFKKRLTEEFGCAYLALDGVIFDPAGSTHKVFYFERKFDNGKILRCATTLEDSEILTPSMIRNVCDRLEVPVGEFIRYSESSLKKIPSSTK